MRTKGAPSAVPPQFARQAGALCVPAGCINSRSGLCANGQFRAGLLSLPKKALSGQQFLRQVNLGDIQRCVFVGASSQWPLLLYQIGQRLLLPGEVYEILAVIILF
jgi:hypothetical protein